MSLDKFQSDIAKDYIATEYQRLEANNDLRFISVPGGMWEDFLTETHKGSNRSRMEFDLTSDFVFRFVGEWTENRAQVVYEPDDDATSDDDAELLTGVYRGDYRENSGQVAKDTAVYEASVCGFGAYKLAEKFVDEEDPENEQQEIIWVPINNAFNTVMFDHNAKRADKADARWVTELTSYTRDAFEEEFPDHDAVSAFTPRNIKGFRWATPQQIYVASRYEIIKKKEKVSVWQNEKLNKIQAYPMDDLEEVKPELIAFGWTHVRDRAIMRQTVMKSIFTGNDFIQEEKRIAGKFLPIVPIYGYRTYVDGEEHYWGLVRKLKDGNRTINMGISKMAESSASSGDTMPILTDDQVDGKEDLWADRTNKNYMVINDLVDANGNPMTTGPVGYLQPSQVDPNTLQAISVISGFMQQKTGNAPQDTVDPKVSGKAINALQKRENLGTKIVSDNIIQSTNHEGKVYESKASEIYTRPQMKRVVGEDGTSRVTNLNQRSLDPQSGNSIDINDLSKGRFSVHVSVGPQYDSQREATVESIERVIGVIGDTPEAGKYMSTLLAVWMNNIDGTGLKPLKDLNRKIMVSSGIIDAETDEEKQMVDQAKNQKDPQQGLVEAATQQQLAEAKALTAKAQGAQAVAMKDIATAGKTQADTQKIKAETSEIVVDINQKLQDGAATRAFNRFAANTRLTGGQ